MNKNHEGYHDPTACEAIRKTGQKKNRKLRRRNKWNCLTYRLEEVPGFKQFMR